MSRSYEVGRPEREHLTDRRVVLLAASMVVGVWLGRGTWLLLVGSGICGLVVLWGRSAAMVVVVACALAIGAVRGDQAWASVTPRHLGPYTGWAELVADPAPYGNGVRVTLEVEGERFDLWLYGGRRDRVAQRQAGEYVWVQGQRTEIHGNARRAALRHVVGGFQVVIISDTDPGAGVARASNRVRRRLRSAAEAAMPPPEAALFTGLVLGDDGREPEWLVSAFRQSGLSHLTAVSGQNVGFVVLAALPLLRRLRPWWRWCATVSFIAWFMALTRFEPSVLRAGVMAILAATAHVRGQQASPVRVLSWAVAALAAIDPLLVWSVGFWLSVAATAGVCLAGPWWFHRLPGPHWLRLALSVTLGAQVGVALPSLLVFHRLPLVSVPANLAAVPVAGAVMLYGIPSAVLAPTLPPPLSRLVMAPNVLGTRWVATVARVAAAVEPPPIWGAAGWLLLIGGLLVRHLRVVHRSRNAPARVAS